MTFYFLIFFINYIISFFSAKAKKVTQELAHWCLTHEDIETQIYFTENKRWKKGFIEESQKTKKKENGHTFTFTPSQHTQRPNPSYSLIIFI